MMGQLAIDHFNLRCDQIEDFLSMLDKYFAGEVTGATALVQLLVSAYTMYATAHDVSEQSELIHARSLGAKDIDVVAFDLDYLLD
jgi:hypothetical protein